MMTQNIQTSRPNKRTVHILQQPGEGLSMSLCILTDINHQDTEKVFQLANPRLALLPINTALHCVEGF